MGDDDTDTIRAEMGEAIATVLGRHGYMVTRWALGADVIDTDGERAMWGLAPEGQLAWDTLGILRYLDHLEAAGLAADAVEGRQ